MELLLRWVANAAALYGTVWILHAFGLAQMAKGPWYAWFLGAVVMGLVNALIQPVARFLTAPLNCLTLGIVGVLVNGLMFWLIPVFMEGLGMPVFTVRPLGAILGAILVGLFSGLLSNLLASKESRRDDE